MDKLNYLIDYLLKESDFQDTFKNHGSDEENKKTLYRALVNIREAKPISSDFLKVENEYLQEELSKKEITDANGIETIKEKYNSKLTSSNKISIWQGDITKLRVGSIVNPANSQGLGCFIPNHNCLDNQIQTLAGVNLRLECNEYMRKINYNLETSHCFITKAYNLPSSYVIHAVGPIVEDELTDDLKQLLADTYINCLNCAKENGVRTIAFPTISTGVFRFPKDEASKIVVKIVNKYLEKEKDNFDKVIFAVYDDIDKEYYESEVIK